MQRADVAFLGYVCSPSLIPKGDELMHDQAKASHYRVFSLNKFTFSGLVFPIIALCVCTLVRYVTKKYVVFLRSGDFKEEVAAINEKIKFHEDLQANSYSSRRPGCLTQRRC